MMKKILGLIFIISSALAVDFYFFLNQPLGVDEEQYYNFAPGSSVSSLARDLEKKQIISNRMYFSVWARVTGNARLLKAGEYQLNKDMTVLDLFGLMKKGKVRLYSLTIVEGITFKQMMQQVNASPNLKHNLKLLNNEQIMQALGHAGEHPEGRFFPDTYLFHKDMSDVDLLRQAYQQQIKRLQSSWESRETGLPLHSAYEALTLASIVEKESAIGQDGKQNGAVFI